MKNLINKKIFNLLRNYFLKDITNKLGKIEITDDKIICYVDNKRLKKEKYLSTYELLLKTKKNYPENILNTYKINKPIYYIIKNMIFEESVVVMAPEDSNITFFNCKFNRELNISSAGDVVLENNQYCDDYGFYRRNILFCAISAKTLKFVNDKFINRSIYKNQTNFGMRIDTNNLEIINSNFNLKNNDGVISVRSQKVFIDNSDINCYNPIYIKADELTVIDTLIRSKKEVVIDNKNNDNYVIGVTSPKTIYNGVDLTKYYRLNSENLELQKARISLIQKLRELRNKCISINSTELKEVENTLNQRSVVKTMKNR